LPACDGKPMHLWNWEEKNLASAYEILRDPVEIRRRFFKAAQEGQIVIFDANGFPVEADAVTNHTIQVSIEREIEILKDYAKELESLVGYKTWVKENIPQIKENFPALGYALFGLNTSTYQDLYNKACDQVVPKIEVDRPAEKLLKGDVKRLDGE